MTGIAEPILTLDVDSLSVRLPRPWQRVLLFGDRGSGKSTLAATMARQLAARGVTVNCISADPGTPAFGPPGVVALGRWAEEAWQVVRHEALCTLDAGRFRLPLVQAVSRLLAHASAEVLLVDAPGVARGVAGEELLTSLAEACRVEAVAVLAGESDRVLPLEAILGSLPAAICRLASAPAARRPDAMARARARTAAWDAHMTNAVTLEVAIDSLRLLGAPPPVAAAEAWRGRQVALLSGDRVVALGEVDRLRGDRVALRSDTAVTAFDGLLVRDLVRRPDGLLATAPATSPARPATFVTESERETRRPLRFDVGAFAVTILNGVCGDPLVVLRPRGARRVLLLDLGEASALSRRVMHRVTDVFVSHAHFDHVAGFLWLLRARMGSVVPPCRMYGPPGLHAHVAGMIAAVRWDRIGGAGPEFEVGEVHGERIERFRIKAGKPLEACGSAPLCEGVLLDEPGLRVSAIELDHGIPVLSFAVESGGERRVRKERLVAAGLPPGPWLGVLKRRIERRELDTTIELPDGRHAPVRALADALVLEAPRVRLVYATDFGDTPGNRARLIAHARGADTLICEATFTVDEAEQAARTWHLTARACGEIAAAAGVKRLVPMHFSKRYETHPGRIYAEIRAAGMGVPLHEIPS